MNILIVAAEMVPFAKTGGLADVVGALSKVMARRGHQVRVVIPCYPAVHSAGVPLRCVRPQLPVRLGSEMVSCVVREALVDQVTVWFLDSPANFERSGIYGTPDGDYPDNHRRFLLLCRGALEMARAMAFTPDLIHCHDWHTALIPPLLRWGGGDRFFAATGTLLTIHNLAFQGLFPVATVAELGIPMDWMQVDRAEFYGMFGFLKAGLMAADRISTVSPTYRQETLWPESGCGLDGVLRHRGKGYVGILNGLDTQEWDPANDPRLPDTYSGADLDGKVTCKAALQHELSLPPAPNVPLLAMISRMTEQKGCDLLLELMPRLAAEQVQLVVLGTGEGKYLREYRSIIGRYPNISLNLEFHPDLGPLIYAGADMFLMPSRFEPCGIGQLMALRYGAVPIARCTGGLADTIVDATMTAEGTGFLFAEYSADCFWGAIQRACAAYRQQEDWRRLVQRGMAADFSWERSVLAYEQLYAVAAACGRTVRDDRRAG